LDREASAFSYSNSIGEYESSYRASIGKIKSGFPSRQARDDRLVALAATSSQDRPLQRPFLNLAWCWDGIAEKAAAPSANLRKAPLGQDGQGIAGMPRCVTAYWTIRVNLVVAVWLPDVAVTVTV
jgi:hypothetical protein